MSTITQNMKRFAVVATAFCALVAPLTASATVSGTDFGLGKVATGVNGTLGNQGLIETVTSIINVALGLLGLVAVVIVLIGGFQWMTAGGNDEKVQGARKMIFSGIIGLAIILSAFAITQFVISNLSRATGSGTVPETY